MKQDINLYQARFRPQRQWLSARQLGVLLLVLVGVLLLLTLHMYRARDAAQAQSGQLKQQQQALQQELGALQQQLDARMADDRWTRREAALRQSVNDYRTLIDQVAERRFGGGEGFSGPLAALTELGSDRVWLERILLSQRDIELQGAALDAASVPQYFERLKQLRVFADHAFERFEIRRSTRYDWKLEFIMATREQSND